MHMLNMANSLVICNEGTPQVDVFYKLRLFLIVLTIILVLCQIVFSITKRPGLKRVSKGLSIVLFMGTLLATGLYFVGDSSPRYMKGNCNSSSGSEKPTIYVEPPQRSE